MGISLPEAVEAFADMLKGYKTNKGTIRLTLDQEIPIALIADIARWCRENSEVRSPEWRCSFVACHATKSTE